MESNLIFEHGGESERQWTIRLAAKLNKVPRESIRRMAAEIYLALGTGLDGYVVTYGEATYAYARELERRRVVQAMQGTGKG